MAESKNKSINGSADWLPALEQWASDAGSAIARALQAVTGRDVAVQAEPPRTLSPERIEALFPDGPLLITVTLTGEGAAPWRFLISKSLAASLAGLVKPGTPPVGEEPDILKELPEVWGMVGAALTPELARRTGREVSVQSVQTSPEPDAFYQVMGRLPVLHWDVAVPGAAVGYVVMAVDRTLVNALLTAPPDMERKEKVNEKPTAKPSPDQAGEEPPVVKPAAFQEFGPAEPPPAEPGPRNLDLLLDINLPITIELGRTSMLIRDVLELGPGSVIELDKLSGEPVDIYVNDRRFARGEVVVIDENFGVRITELLKVDERLRELK